MAEARNMNAGTAESRNATRYVVFAVETERFAVDLESVDRVVHAVEVTPVGGVPAAVIGSVILRGERIPVIDMRRRLGMPERELELTDQFLLVHRGALRWFLIADEVVGVVEIDDAAVSRREGDRSDCRASNLVFEEGTVARIDLGRLLTGPEAKLVLRVMAQGAAVAEAPE